MSILSVDTIQPIGSGSTVTLNAAKIVVGTGITFESNGQAIYAGIVTATGADINGDLDVDGHTNLDNVSIAGVTTVTGTGTNGLFKVERASGAGLHIQAQSALGVFGTTSNHNLRLISNGNERILLSTNGNVGINESSPSHKLVVGGDIGIGFNTPNDAGRQLNFNVNRGSAGDTLANINWQWNSKYVAQIRGIAGADTTNKDDGHLAFFTSAANSLVERLRITSAGKVGIGTDTPYNPLDVIGSSADILIYDTDAYSQNSNGGALSLQGNDSAGNRKTLADVRGVANGANIGEFAIRTRRTGGTLTEALRITSDGSTQINSGVLQRRYESSGTAGYRYYSKADRFLIAHGGSGTNLTITGMNQGWASIRFGGYTEGNRVNFRADIGGYNAGNAGVRLYDSNEITNQATAYAGGASCSITVTKNNASYVVNITQSNAQNATMASFYHFETGGYNSVSTLTIS